MTLPALITNLICALIAAAFAFAVWGLLFITNLCKALIKSPFLATKKAYDDVMAQLELVFKDHKKS